MGLEPDHAAGWPVPARPLLSQHAGCSGGLPSALDSAVVTEEPRHSGVTLSAALVLDVARL